MTKGAKAQTRKRRAEVGRRRLFIAPRELNGRLQRGSVRERAEDAMATMVQARIRHLGITKEVAETPIPGHALKFMAMKSKLPFDRSHLVQAGERFGELRADLDKLHPIRPLGSTCDYDKHGGFDNHDGLDSDYIEHSKRVRSEYAEARHELVRTDELALMAIETIVIDNVIAWTLERALWDGLHSLAHLWNFPRYNAT